MRAIFAVLALAIALVGGAGPAPAAAAAPDNTGPACTDIVASIDGIYSTNGAGNAIFTFTFGIGGSVCKNATYTLRITDNNGGLVTASYPGGLSLCASSTTQFCFTHNYGATSSAATPSVLRVTGETRIGGHVADSTQEEEYELDGAIGDNSWDQ